MTTFINMSLKNLSTFKYDLLFPSMSFSLGETFEEESCSLTFATSFGCK